MYYNDESHNTIPAYGIILTLVLKCLSTFYIYYAHCFCPSTLVTLANACLLYYSIRVYYSKYLHVQYVIAFVFPVI